MVPKKGILSLLVSNDARKPAETCRIEQIVVQTKANVQGALFAQPLVLERWRRHRFVLWLNYKPAEIAPPLAGNTLILSGKKRVAMDRRLDPLYI